jgi:hypothetical protein
VKASPTTVGTVRAQMEDTGLVSRLDTRTDKRGRQQPANKPPVEEAPPTAPAAEPADCSAEARKQLYADAERSPEQVECDHLVASLKMGRKAVSSVVDWIEKNIHRMEEIEIAYLIDEALSLAEECRRLVSMLRPAPTLEDAPPTQTVQ